MTRRFLLATLGTAALAIGCAKEEPRLTASLHAKCKGCVVSYAGGVMQSKKDTLRGVVDPGTGDTLPEERSWKVEVKEGDNLFLRACRLDSADTAFGMELRVDGDVRPVQAYADTARCMEINRAVQKP
ncbi:MAG TPA: hypothetical protein PKD45_06615 [Flavobacteriales bacterium]|nr:hypothetical protein [Flavobacteriales bacterium]